MEQIIACISHQPCAAEDICRGGRGGKTKPSGDEQLESEEKKESLINGNDEFLLCVVCKQLITSRKMTIVVQGSAQHTFANPHGLLYEIGCFQSATGCVPHGTPTTEFSWFVGHSWVCVYCRSCGLHLGWKFTSSGGSQFHGLILDRLILGEDGREAS